LIAKAGFPTAWNEQPRTVKLDYRNQARAILRAARVLTAPQPPAQPSADAERLDFIADHVPFGALDSFGGMSLPVGSDDVRNDLREAIDDAIRHSRAFAARAARPLE